MAPKTAEKRRQNAEVAEFVRALYEASGFGSWGEYARAIGKAPATISDWSRGENAPGGYNLLRLIHAATEKQANAFVKAKEQTRPVSPLEHRLVAVEERVEQTRLLVAEGFRRVLGEEL